MGRQQAGLSTALYAGSGDRVPVDNYMEGDGSLLAEKEEEEKAKRLQKKREEEGLYKARR